MRRVFILTVMLFCLSSVNATTIEQAMWDYNNGKFEQAYKKFSELAKLGNTKAQFNIGVMYARGEFVEVDLAESLAWFRLVKNNNGEENTDNVTKIIEAKLTKERLLGVDKLLIEISKTYGSKAIKENYLPESKTNDTEVFESAKVKIKSKPRYPTTMLKRGFSGVVDLEFLVERDGTVRYPTVLASTNNSFAKASIEAVLSNKYIPAKLNDRPVYEYGRRMRFIFEIEHAEVDKNKVARYVEPLREEAITGGGQAKYTYAYTLAMIDSLGSNMDGYDEINLEDANLWFSKAAQDGYSPAKYELGKRLAYGTYCRVDAKKALFWLEQASAQGLLEAKLMLGMEYLSGGKTEQNLGRGQQLIKEAAENGLDHAMLRYAWILASAEKSDKAELELAKGYFEKVEQKKYEDKLSYYETATALYAALGDFKKAQAFYKRSLKELEKMDLESVRLQNIKAAIDNSQAYIEII